MANIAMHPYCFVMSDWSIESNKGLLVTVVVKWFCLLNMFYNSISADTDKMLPSA